MEASVVSEVLCDILQKYAFVFPEPVEADNALATESRLLRVEMGFSGDRSGVFELFAPLELCREITANLLGYDLDDPFVNNNPEDGMKEILNIVGAHCLSRIFGDDKRFNVAIPSYEWIERPQALIEDRNRCEVALNIEGRFLGMNAKLAA
jgi:hypothetical protein